MTANAPQGYPTSCSCGAQPSTYQTCGSNGHADNSIPAIPVSVQHLPQQQRPQLSGLRGMTAPQPTGVPCQQLAPEPSPMTPAATKIASPSKPIVTAACSIGSLEASACASAKVQPDLGSFLRGDCWKSPLCPRNAAARQLTSSPRNVPAAIAIESPAPPATAPILGSESVNGDSYFAARPSNPTSTATSPLETPMSDANGLQTSKPTDSSSSTSTAAKPSRRLPHTVVEKRYRENFNKQIETLRSTIPPAASCLSTEIEDLGGPSSSSSRSTTKAAVIAGAIEYMKHLRSRHEQIANMNAEFKAKVEALTKLVNCEDCSIMQYAVQSGILTSQGQVQATYT
ncbi:hypothetical protein H2203_001275 [Taxawa tesnikishii (nom. ined.)]|nr:hypothetical protein H2203_001275 [Dothideales sp. JES 119]